MGRMSGHYSVLGVKKRRKTMTPKPLIKPTEVIKLRWTGTGSRVGVRDSGRRGLMYEVIRDTQGEVSV